MVLVVIGVVVAVVPVVIFVIPVVDTRNIPFKFGWNQVIDRWEVVDVVVVSVVVSVVVGVVAVIVVVDVVVVDSRNIPLKLS